MEIEDGGGSGTSGSHLEQRIYYNEVMAGSSTPNPAYSQISLAVFYDSGWYDVDWSRATDGSKVRGALGYHGATLTCANRSSGASSAGAPSRRTSVLTPTRAPL